MSCRSHSKQSERSEVYDHGRGTGPETAKESEEQEKASAERARFDPFVLSAGCGSDERFVLSFLDFECSILDMEEVVESLLAKTNNNGFEFVYADLKIGHFIVRYFINNSHVRIVFSFKKPDSLPSVPSTTSWLPYNFSRTTMDSTRSQPSSIAFEYLSLDGALDRIS